MSKHAPGPWTIGEYGRVVDASGKRIRLSGVALATGHVGDDDECYANDRLISAAPEMLDALRESLPILKEFGSVGHTSATIAALGIMKAIAKATGEPT